MTKAEAIARAKKLAGTSTCFISLRPIPEGELAQVELYPYELPSTDAVVVNINKKYQNQK